MENWLCPKSRFDLDANLSPTKLLEMIQDSSGPGISVGRTPEYSGDPEYPYKYLNKNYKYPMSLQRDGKGYS